MHTHTHTQTHYKNTSTQTFANDLLPTFHHSSLESSMTCTRSPGLKDTRQKRRCKGEMIEVWR